MTDKPSWQARGKLAIELLAPAHTERPGLSEQVYALLVGVGSFGLGIPPLPGAIRDVSALHLALGSGHYGACDSQLLTDPSHQQLEAAMVTLCDKSHADETATILIFMATHGLYHDGAYHLCLHESQRTDGHTTKTLPFETLRQWCNPLAGRPLVLLLDSCRHAEDEQAAEGPTHWTSAPDARDDIALPGQNWAVVTSAAPGQSAWEAPGQTHKTAGAPHGLFAEALLQELATPGHKGERTLRIGATHEGIRERMAQRLAQRPTTHAQDPILYANFTRDIRIGQRALAINWAPLQDAFCAQVQFAPLYQLPLPQPPAGTCYIRPKDTSMLTRSDLCQLGIETEWKGFVQGEGSLETIVVTTAPTLDEMLAATGLFLKEQGTDLAGAWASLATYAHNLRVDAFALQCPAQASLGGLFAALVAQTEWPSSQGRDGFLRRWCQIVETCLWQVAQQGQTIDPFCPHDPTFATERSWLSHDRQAFLDDCQRGREWARVQSEVSLPDGLYLLLEPTCQLPHLWVAQDVGQAPGAERECLLWHYQGGRWMLCVAPSQRARLQRIEHTLAPLESGGSTRLLESLPFATLASPPATTLSPATLLFHVLDALASG